MTQAETSKEALQKKKNGVQRDTPQRVVRTAGGGTWSYVSWPWSLPSKKESESNKGNDAPQGDTHSTIFFLIHNNNGMKQAGALDAWYTTHRAPPSTV